MSSGAFEATHAFAAAKVGTGQTSPAAICRARLTEPYVSQRETLRLNPQHLQQAPHDAKMVLLEVSLCHMHPPVGF